MLKEAAQDIRTRLQAQAATLKNYNQEFLATREAIRVSPSPLASCSCILPWGRVGATTRCSPRVTGQLLS